VFTPTALGARTGTLTVSDNATTTPQTTQLSGSGISSNLIQHIVVIVQENRTPDNMFQDPVLIANGADVATSGVNSLGQIVPLTATPLVLPYDLNHGHADFVAMYDNGKMDGADKIKVNCFGVPNCAPPNPQFKYVQASDLGPYFQMAEQYVFGDRMFQTNQGPSLPAHQFLFAGTSAPTATSNLFVSENGSLGGNGCIAPAGATVPLIGPDGQELQSNRIYPCFEHSTLADELDAAGLSWHYYTAGIAGIWTAPTAINHICQPQTQNGQLICTGPVWKSNVIVPQTQVLTDITNQQLPAVSWVIPSGRSSDHAGQNDGSGPSWVASIVNAIGNSSYWSNTAIIITWDDWGGWYDHVSPPQVLVNCTQWGCGYVYGFRVPLIVVSPYAKAAYISHTPHDFGSILKFIEEQFGLPSLGYADNYADDLSDCFNFSQTPLPFQIIRAPISAGQFLNDQRPPTDPDDD
jgi:phospholipase C